MLKPEISLPVGLATAALVWAIFQTHLPNVTDVRASKPHNDTLDASRKMATWEAAGIVAGVSLIAHDPTVFIIGGTMVAVLDFTHRHANAVSPSTNKVAIPPSAGTAVTSS